MEIWKKTHLSEDYEVSNLGRVKSLKNGREKILRIGTNTKGYNHLVLSLGGKQKCITIHRLVCEAFIENKHNYKQINHKDGVKTNNNVENLEWCNNSTNQKHACKNGLQNTKLNSDDVVMIRNFIKLNVYSQREIAEAFNVDPSIISDINTRKIWYYV